MRKFNPKTPSTHSSSPSLLLCTPPPLLLNVLADHVPDLLGRKAQLVADGLRAQGVVAEADAGFYVGEGVPTTIITCLGAAHHEAQRAASGTSVGFLFTLIHSLPQICSRLI